MNRTITTAIAGLLALSATATIAATAPPAAPPSPTAAAAGVGPATTAAIVVKDGRTQPENLTVTPGGDVISGSFSTPMINIVRRGATTAETFVDLTNDGGGTTLGVLADAGSSTLWACQSTSGEGGRQTHLRGFDLATGAAKLRWTLPSPSTCNDFAVAPDRSLYIADTSGKIYKLAPGAQTATLFLDGPAVAGIDGISFLNGQLYYNSITTSRLFRVPIGADGRAGAAVEIAVTPALSRPDGMRSANGKLFVAEQGGNRISALTIAGDTASLSVVKDGLQRPTGVQPAGNSLWYAELTPGRVSSIPLPQ